MHLHADRLLLSPSDLTAFLACEHLTALSLRAARGEIVMPTVEDEQCELVFRKGFFGLPTGHPLKLRTEGLDG